MLVVEQEIIQAPIGAAPINEGKEVLITETPLKQKKNTARLLVKNQLVVNPNIYPLYH